MNIIGDPIIAANTGSDEIVIISDSQPTEEDNKLWVKNTLTGEGVEIPTMSDVEYMADVRTIAPVEATTTASRAYQKGDFFVLSDKLYKAKAAIASGGTIVIGTNCEEVQVGSELKNLNNVTESIDDLEESVDELSNTLSHKADAIYDTAIGDIASFPDGADGLPVKDLTVGIEPVQSGTGDPSPENVRPISGWTSANVSRTGKNLFAGQHGDIIYLPFPQNTIFTVSTDVHQSGNTQFSVYDKNKTRIDFWNINTLTADGTRYYRQFNLNYDVYYVMFGSLNSGRYQINYGTNTAYTEPGTIFPITFPSPDPGTVYGGSIDWIAKKLKSRPYYASYNGEPLVGPWISSMDVYAPDTTPTIGAQVVDMGGAEAITDLTVAPEIDTLYGTNNIWADCGPSTVEYPCDTKLYIQKINTPTDDDMIADANIASGQYFIVNNNLYISTAAILAGDPIKPGTNCTLTNLAAALNALNS